MVNDIIKQSLSNIKKNNIKTILEIQNNSNFIITMSKKMEKDCGIIKDFLLFNVYNNKKLKHKRIQVELIIEKLFKYFVNNFNKLPEDWFIQKNKEDKHRIICD